MLMYINKIVNLDVKYQRVYYNIYICKTMLSNFRIFVHINYCKQLTFNVKIYIFSMLCAVEYWFTEDWALTCFDFVESWIYTKKIISC